MKKYKSLLILLAIVLLLAGLWYWYTHREVTVAKTEPTLEREAKACPYTYVSWNMANFGRKKSPKTIAQMANIVCKRADIIAAQEINGAGGFGAQAVAKLAEECSQMGSEWDYIVSDNTLPHNDESERYAFLWKKNIFSTNRDKAELLKELEQKISREPFRAIFIPKKGEAFSVYTMHAVPTAKLPINEIRALESSSELKGVKRSIFSGDFNLDKRATDPSFNQLGFYGSIDEPTSLKQKLTAGKYRVKQYDNIYTTKDVHVCSSGVIDFVENAFSPVTNESLNQARKLSDHLPVYITFK